MVGWHNRLDGQDFYQVPGIGDGHEAWGAAVQGLQRVGRE